MQLEIGFTTTYDLTLYNLVQSIGLEDSRQVETDEAIEGTAWFNIRGRKKPRFALQFTEQEFADLGSDFKKIQERTIPDYFLPVFAKLTTANQTDKYSTQTEFEGACQIHLKNKAINQIPTWRDFEILIYAL